MSKFIPTIRKTGEYELADSGIFHILEREKTLIEYPGIKIFFIFETSDDKKSSIQLRVIERGIEILLFNIRDVTYGTTDLVKIGQIDGKNIYISFRVNSLNDKNLRTLEYSLYVGN